MVLEENYSGNKAYKCEECGMHYQDRSTAERCEAYCREEGMCNSEITKKSLERKQQ